MNLSPYAKTVVSAVGTLVIVVLQYIVGDGADAATLGTAIIGLLTTLGVFQVTNAPMSSSSSAIQPSVYTMSSSTPTHSEGRIMPIAAKARKKKTAASRTPEKKATPRNRVFAPTKEGE